MHIRFIPATENRGFPDQGSQDPARMQRGKIKDKYFINTLKYCFLVWALQGGWGAWWLVVPSRETNCINNIMIAKNPASSDLDFSLHTSFKTCCSEAPNIPLKQD